MVVAAEVDSGPEEGALALPVDSGIEVAMLVALEAVAMPDQHRQRNWSMDWVA